MAVDLTIGAVSNALAKLVAQECGDLGLRAVIGLIAGDEIAQEIEIQLPARLRTPTEDRRS